MAKSNNKKQSVSKIIQDKVERPERLTLKKSRDLVYEKFRTNLRTLCAASSLSMIDISKDSGLESGKRITDLQYGRGNPSMDEMIVISKYFKISIDDLLNKTATITFL